MNRHFFTCSMRRIGEHVMCGGDGKLDSFLLTPDSMSRSPERIRYLESFESAAPSVRQSTPGSSHSLSPLIHTDLNPIWRLWFCTVDVFKETRLLLHRLPAGSG